MSLASSNTCKYDPVRSNDDAGRNYKRYRFLSGKWYILDQVEDQLFKVPIFNFTLESEVFRTMFELPQDATTPRDGLTDEKPIRLDGDVKKHDFKQLLRVMYARPFTVPELELEEKEWISVLVLAERWEMDRLRKLAISKLAPSFKTDPHKLVVMGSTYDVDSWLTSGIYLLTLRDDPINEDDVNLLGISASLKVSALREWSLQWRIAHRDSADWIINRLGNSNMPPERLLQKIRETFSLRDPA